MNADVIIIGRGIIGCAADYNLAKENISVIVLEASNNIGNGGLTRNGRSSAYGFFSLQAKTKSVHPSGMAVFEILS